ncbi:hypothetical protein IQ225_06655 [Synechocystis salina LEGE 06155]|nr:hypothetical protein [Synechocystis salina LEGE 06155]
MNKSPPLMVIQESLGLVVIYCAFFAIAIWGAGKFHPVWLDEVALVEPATNLYFSGEFSSTAWYHQSNESFHVGTSLLYTFLLSIWVKLLGFGIVRVRLFGYIVIATASFILFKSVKRLHIVNYPYLRLLLVLTFLTIGGINYIYISGRYDVICLFLSVLAIYSFSLKQGKLRTLVLLFISILFPLSGISALVFAVLIAIALLVFNYKLFWREVLAFIIGSAIGLLFLYILYSINGVWGDFISLVSGHSEVATSKNFSYFINLLITSAQKLTINSYGCEGCITYKSSWRFLVVISLILVFHELLTRTFKLCCLLFFGLVIALTLPFAMCFLGKFPIYYSWMAILPLLLGIFSATNNMLEKYGFKLFSKNLIYLFISILLILSMKIGLFEVFATALQDRDFDENQALSKFINDNTNSDDIAYADFSTFYSIKGTVDEVYFPLYSFQLQANERDSISVVILDGRQEKMAPWNPSLQQIFPETHENWKDTGQHFVSPQYNLKVYKPRSKKLLY